MQGEGGFYIAPVEFLKELRGLCDEHGILLIADEIQSGFARTGKMFAHRAFRRRARPRRHRQEPGRRLPALRRDRPGGDHGRARSPGGLGGTYAGNPVACAAALAVLDVIEEEKLLERADAVGERIKAKLQAMARSNDLLPIAAIRGLGAMIAFEIVKERGGYEPDPEATKR